MNAPNNAIEIEPAGTKTTGKCHCCGNARRTVWGYVYKDGGPRAAYFVEWTTGRKHGAARFDVVVGDWNDGTTENDREAVSLQYDRDSGFDVVDAAGRPAAEIGRATERAAVVGTPVAEEAITIAHVLLGSDERIRELMNDEVLRLPSE